MIALIAVSALALTTPRDPTQRALFAHGSGDGKALSSSSGTDFAQERVAEFAQTRPLVGKTKPYNWKDAALAQLKISACAPLAATIDRHTAWFNGEPLEQDHSAGPLKRVQRLGVVNAQNGTSKQTNQQDGEREFVSAIRTSLCARPDQSEDEYTTILHGMFKEVRTHINRHVHSAFWVKEACAEMDHSCYSNEPTSGDFDSGLVQGCTTGNPDGITCVGSVLDHEKYNLAEGWYFVNLSYSLLERGASFCLLPDLDKELERMTTELEAVLHAHSSAHQFDELLDAHFATLCTLPDDHDTDYAELYRQVAEQIDADVADDNQDCLLYPEAFEAMPFIKSNPPSVDDLITMFVGDTNTTLLAASEVVGLLLASSGCIDPETQETDWASANTIGDMLFRAGMVTNFTQAGDSSLTCPTIHQQSLGTVYHKLLCQCSVIGATWAGGVRAEEHSPADPSVGERDLKSLYTEPVASLYDIPGGSLSAPCRDGYGQPYAGAGVVTSFAHVFDIVTSTDIDTCHGEACKRAARAIIDYQALLGIITPLRTDLLEVTEGFTPTLPIMEADQLVFQRSCDAFKNIAERALDVRAKLPVVASELRAAAPQLEVTCIASTRDKNNPRSEAALGEDTSAKNAAVWNDAVSYASDTCKAGARSR